MQRASEGVGDSTVELRVDAEQCLGDVGLERNSGPRHVLPLQRIENPSVLEASLAHPGEHSRAAYVTANLPGELIDELDRCLLC